MSPLRKVNKVLTKASHRGDSLLETALRFREWAVWAVLAAIGINVVVGIARVANLMGQGLNLAEAVDVTHASAFFNLGWVLLLVAAVFACAAVRRPTPNATRLTFVSGVVVAAGAGLEVFAIVMSFVAGQGGIAAGFLSLVGSLLDLLPRLLVAAVLLLVWRTLRARTNAPARAYPDEVPGE